MNIIAAHLSPTHRIISEVAGPDGCLGRLLSWIISLLIFLDLLFFLYPSRYLFFLLFVLWFLLLPRLIILFLP